MKKILNFFGLFTSKQYTDLLKQNLDLEKQVHDLPKNFDYLLGIYKPAELNAFFYKAVNVCYNQPPYKYLIERWYQRIKSLHEGR